ncbi:hypothetical protein BKA70DRAFT_398306 [Coprinopsis sp. MPI-PUGE-AT-0042]|nr:hypothetical protein BKA70DRAFT_398306 [Coprinopsis sp. MPI-PUGE-AT-0042]
MSFSTSTPRTSERPTLPPFKTLESLADQGYVSSSQWSSRSTFVPYPRSAPATCSRYTHGLRKASISSSNTSGSERSPSPTPSVSSRSSSLSPSSPLTPVTPSGQVRLVRCDMQEANALILVPAPDTPFTHPVLKGAKPGQSLLLVGHAMQQFVRHPQREISRGARMHPYRAIPITSNTSSRRSSVASMTSSISMSGQ